MLENKSINCPYCGESIQIMIDVSTEDSAGISLADYTQTYTEDCQVCCRPITINYAIDSDGELISFNIQREDDC